ncbi:gap junction delta-4 protein-like [Mugil cephalus]|uniref:gap junction delta-4 protein-like n=1 Tax=Mugil cephalus TaxID=48193 RepID=UPI001FB7D8BA|nr:gap junction delta-4 protein-like [Mugil cephalus]
MRVRTMGAFDVFFITISHNVSFIGKTWWVLMLVLRVLVLLLAGFTLFSDEQEQFICNTLQPGCSNVCFNVFAPVSVLRLWLFHLILLCLPHAVYATYVMHKVLSHGYFGSFYWSRGGSPLPPENSSSSREHELTRELGAPRFYCSYFLVVILRMVLEAVFGAGQFFLFGLALPKSFFCYEAPCTSGVECYISRPTEKTLMLNFMLGVASLSILLSFVDLASSAKAMVRWRRKREMLVEEMSKGEQSSMLTTTTVTDDSDIISTRRISGNSKMNGLTTDENLATRAVPNSEPLLTKAGHTPKTSEFEKSSESKDAKVETSQWPTAMGTAAPTHYILHSQLRPALSPRPDRGPLPNPGATTPMGVKKMSQCAPAGVNSGQQPDSSETKDKRAWV